MNRRHAHDLPPAEPAARARALADALSEKGLIPEGFIEKVIARAESWSPRNGARVVARAWLDTEYRKRLLTDGTAACAELGYSGPQGEYIVALENTQSLHNVIVCTQCSCTAWPVLGLPPNWYKSPEYRARVVREPRRVLLEMGLDLPTSIAIRVWETSAETRYLILPMRPAGTEAYNADQLACLVSREALIGVALVGEPVWTTG
jgi:nitrile hydratase subunit alpha